MLRRASSALGLAASVAGLPLLLLAAAGPPSLAGLPTWVWLRTGMHNQYLPLDPLLRLLALLAWLLWLYLALTVALRTLAVVAVSLKKKGSGALLAATEWLTLPRLRHLVDAVIGVSLLASSVSHLAAARPAHHARVATVASPAAVAAGPAAWARTRTLLDVATQPAAVVERAADEDGPDQAAHHLDPPAPRPSTAAVAPGASQAPTYVVQPGDSLWQIAEQQLGDPLRWHELWQLNRDRRMPDGRVLHRPGLILPGWVLRLPTDAAPPAASPPETVPPTTMPGAPPTRRPEPGAHGPTTTRPPRSATPKRSPAPGQGEEHQHEHPTRPPTDHDGQRPHSHVELPSGAVVGLSLALAISAALAAARLHRRRRWQPADPAPGISHTDPLVTDTVRRLHHAARTATAAGEPDDEQDDNDQTLAPRATEAPPAVPPTQTLPGPLGVVAVGHRDGSEVTLDLPATGGLA